MAREFIGNGAVTVNGEKVSDNATELDWASAFFGKYFLLKSVGKSFFICFINPKLGPAC